MSDSSSDEAKATGEIRHFLFREHAARDAGDAATCEIVEYSAEEAAAVALGDAALPEFSGSKTRYVQVWVDDEINGNELQVRTAAAVVSFDDDGHFADAQPAEAQREDSQRGDFEHDTCVQLAVRTRYPDAFTVH
ncbi:hypothetical protein GYB61_13200 [bacterium]|nr:hypothetical protein [bacterium]